MQFRNDSDEHSTNGNSYLLADFPILPRESSGAFDLKRDAGTMHFTGRFEGNQGMGHYRFEADPAYADFLRRQGLEPGDASDRLVLFFVNASRSFISGVLGEGYKDITREDLIPMAALHIDAAYIRSIKATGLKDISSEELIPFKSLGIDAAYIDDIRRAYPNVSADQLISFKAQGIDSRYIQALRSNNGKGRAGRDSGSRPRRDNERDANRNNARNGEEASAATNEEVIGKAKTKYRAVQRIRDARDERDDELNTLVGMKAVGVDDAYIESIYAACLNAVLPIGKCFAALRREQAISRGEQLTTGQLTYRSYTDLFPSVFLQDRLSDRYNVGLSYSRRLLRVLSDRTGYDRSVLRVSQNVFRMLQSNQTLQLPRNFRPELNGRYVGEALSGLYIMQPYFRLDLGVRKRFPKAHLDLSFNANDVFASHRLRFHTQIGANRSDFDQYLNFRTLNLSLRYTFSKGQRVGERRRGNVEEMNRAGLGG